MSGRPVCDTPNCDDLAVVWVESPFDECCACCDRCARAAERQGGRMIAIIEDEPIGVA